MKASDNSQKAEPSTKKSEPRPVVARVEKFPVTAPKFTKETWDSGEGGGSA